MRVPETSAWEALEPALTRSGPAIEIRARLCVGRIRSSLFRAADQMVFLNVCPSNRRVFSRVHSVAHVRSVRNLNERCQ